LPHPIQIEVRDPVTGYEKRHAVSAMSSSSQVRICGSPQPASRLPRTDDQPFKAGLAHYWWAVREPLTGYLFIAPAVLLITLFGVFPVGYAAYMSLYHWRVRQGAFVGLGNYVRVLGDDTGIAIMLGSLGLLGLVCWLGWRGWPVDKARRGGRLVLMGLGLLGTVMGLIMGWSYMQAGAPDGRFILALRTTFFYALGTLPLQLILGLALAVALFQNLRGTALFRVVFFVPYVMPTVATAMVFRLLFSERSTSLANQMLMWLGLAPQKWLAESRPVLEVVLGWQLPAAWAGPSLALVTIILFSTWTFVGYYVVVFLAGLSAIPPEVYDAGKVDGADEWALFRYITLPLLSPVTFYLVLIGFIGTFKAFNSIYAMRVPQALGTVDTVSVVIFDTLYKANQYGEAAAQAILLFGLMAALTYIQQRWIGSRVFYGS
jgi:multiple sugar transport system permease protein